MPTTVASSHGRIYHLWQLPDLSSPQPVESIAFNTLENDLSNGYFSSVLFGSDTGLRTFELKFPGLGHADVLPNTVTGINGDTLSREAYLWELYCECKVTGEPFAYQSSRNGQYYLVRFLDKDLTYERMKVKIYSTGIKLQQVRQSGNEIFSIGNMQSPAADAWFNEASVVDKIGNGNTFTVAGDVLSIPDTAVDLFQVWSFNSVSNTGKVTQADPRTIYDIFIVMTVRESLFGQESGVLSGTTSVQILTGETGTTTFHPPSAVGTSFEYRLNGLLYDDFNQQAPMAGNWGLVHVHSSAGITFTPQMGQICNLGTGTKAEIDVGEVVWFVSPAPNSMRREITESLMVKWGLT